MNQEEIRNKLLEHSRSPKNGNFPLYANRESKKTNPLCGDHVEIKLEVEKNFVKNIGFKAQACAICSASASVLSQEIVGKNVDAILAWTELFETTIADSKIAKWPSEIEFLQLFEHIKVTPSRKMCALLPWIVLKSALK